MKSIIIGTAGHIDHGKTALVRALTGIDADRLPEEQRRGITIDIGFADLDLGEVRIGFVDVPGHERFVKNMLAGAHGIDAVALVIAADESVMPQTREHFEICRLLNVSKGLIVLTKKDLVDEDLLSLVQAEVEEMSAGSFLAGAPIVAVSSRTGEGIEELKEVLREIGSAVPARAPNCITRLPIDRAFTMRGFGAVVTGTLISGEINEGDELELLPAGARVRVRGLQVHGAAVKRAFAGQRTAVNLGGVDTANLQRGMVLATAASLCPTQIIDAHIQILENAPRALKSRQRVRVHHGAAEVLARVRVLEPSGEIKPGGSGFAQLRFESPVVAVLGDRFIIRSYSPQVTIGGGGVLDPLAAKHRTRDAAAAREWLASLASSDRPAQLALLVSHAGPRGLRRAELVARTGWDEALIEQIKDQVKQNGAIVEAEGVLVGAAAFAELEQLVVKAVVAHHKSEPLSRGLPKESLRERYFTRMAAEVFRGVLAHLEQTGILIAEKEIIRQREHTREPAGADAELRDLLDKIYRDAGLAAPIIAEAFARAGVNSSNQQQGRKVLQLLIDSGNLVRVDGEMFFHLTALTTLRAKLQAYAEQGSKERAIDVATFKELAGISRKYAIPLLEYLDRQRVTRREGDRRIIL